MPLQAPIRTQLQDKNINDFHRSMNEWGHFVEDVRSFYDVDLSCVSADFEKVSASLTLVHWLEYLI